MKAVCSLFLGLICMSTAGAWADEAPAVPSYDVHFTTIEMRIDHFAAHTRYTAAQRKNGCDICLAYSQPVMGYTGRMELPLFSTDRLGMAGWGAASPGDYILHFNETPLYTSAIKLVFNARF